MKLNLGCGEKRIPGFLNVDKYGTPEFQWDLEQFPWPWEDNSVDEIQMIHVLEHLGQQTDQFLTIMKELYRVCCNGAKIEIKVPHPRHDDFLNDPTHVRPITMEILDMFSQKSNRQWIEMGASNSLLGMYNGVDFEIADGSLNLDPIWLEKMKREGLSGDQVIAFSKSQNNVIKEIHVILKVIK